MYNPSAITAPMNLPRWAVGGLIVLAPITLGQFVKNDLGRTSLQMFGFGAGARIVGKGLIDLIAMLTKKTATGQRLYDGEMRAMSLKAGDGSEASLPSAGLGKPAGSERRAGTGCAVGCACASCQAVAAQIKAGQAGAPGNAGTGWPSMPRETATTTAPPTLAPPPPPPPPPPQAPLTGVPAARAPRNPFKWGNEEAA